jgi:hypothetical protein
MWLIGHWMSLSPYPRAGVVEPSSCLTCNGLCRKLVKCDRSLLIKQLAPPSLCSSEWAIKSNNDGDAVVSQL